MQKSRLYHIPVIILLLAALAACGGRLDRKASRCRISPTGSVVAGSPMTWTVDYRVPEPGFAPGGFLLVLFPPSYYADRPQNIFPQVSDEKTPGFTRARINGREVALEIVSFPDFPAVAKLAAGSEGFKPGDNIEILMGVSPSGRPSFKAPNTACSTFAPIVLSDATGDGRPFRVAVEDDIEVLPAKAVRADIVVPAYANASDPFEITVRFLDAYGNISKPEEPVNMTLTLEGELPFFTPPPPKTLQEAWGRVPGGSLSTTGYYYLVADFGGAFGKAVSNPVRVGIEKNPRRIFFGDLRQHSSFSDGVKTPEEIYDFAAGPGALSFVAVADSLSSIDEAEAARLRLLSRERMRLGAFIPVAAAQTPGVEGFAHYYDRGDILEELFSAAPLYAWETIAGRVAASPSDEFDDEDFDRSPAYSETTASVPLPAADDDLRRWGLGKMNAVEIHSSRKPVFADAAVNRALAAGLRISFLASSDGIDGRPGVSVPGERSCALTALETGALTSRTVFDALSHGRTYATTGARIIINTDRMGRPPGVTPILADNSLIRFEIAGTAPIRTVEVVKDGLPVKTLTPDGEKKIFLGEWSDNPFDKPCSLYLHVTQSDGEQAWSSPFYLDHPDYASIKSFRAVRRGDTVEVLIDSVFGRKTESLSVLRRTGDDGEADPDKYTSAGAAFPAGRIIFRDRSPQTNAPTFYLLYEANSEQDRILGPIFVSGSASPTAADKNQALENDVEK